MFNVGNSLVSVQVSKFNLGHELQNFAGAVLSAPPPRSTTSYLQNGTNHTCHPTPTLRLDSSQYAIIFSQSFINADLFLLL